MNEIKLLDRNVSEKIAAGEVVERPASIVKELIENSLDAGATSVTVEIKDGGKTFIRVTDNGKGMYKDDVPTAFLRHATSKIKDEADLESIKTLGFRGEALCSISAVSHTELFTKRLGCDTGSFISIKGGETQKFEETGVPFGTTIVVRDLFYNTPARMKFLKKDSTEAGYVSDVCQKQALSRPDISIRLIKDGKDVFFTPGDNSLKNAVHCVLGKDFAKEMIEVNYEGAVNIRGLIGKNVLSRPNRNMQITFVNSRCVTNKVIFSAISEAYKNELMTGRFPVAVINIETDPKSVDVNVHPSKTEVKFENDRVIFDSVYWAVKNTLMGETKEREAVISNIKKADYFVPHKKTEAEQLSMAQTEKSIFKPFFVDKKELFKEEPTKNVVKEPTIKYEENIKPLFEKEEKSEVVKYEEPIKYIGQLFSTYLLAQKGNDLLLIDQHAGHERLKYEELIKTQKCVSQQLLSPVSLDLLATEKEVAFENEAFFENMGFEFEEFGTNKVIIRSVPSGVSESDSKSLFCELIALFSGEEKGETIKKREKALYTVACKAAIKANRILDKSEAQELIEKIWELEGVSTCPHGRPIVVKVTKYEIEKMFKRIV